MTRPSAPRAPVLAVATTKAAERRRQVVEKGCEWSRHSFASSDNDVVATGFGLSRQNLAGRRAQPPPNPIADNSLADLSARREAHTHHARGHARRVVVRAATLLEDQTRRNPLPPDPRRPEEIRAALQRRNIRGHTTGSSGKSSSGEALAPSPAPLGQNPPPADGRRPLAKAVPPFADDLAWLERTFQKPAPTPEWQRSHKGSAVPSQRRADVTLLPFALPPAGRRRRRLIGGERRARTSIPCMSGNRTRFLRWGRPCEWSSRAAGAFPNGVDHDEVNAREPLRSH